MLDGVVNVAVDDNIFLIGLGYVVLLTCSRFEFLGKIKRGIVVFEGFFGD